MSKRLLLAGLATLVACGGSSPKSTAPAPAPAAAAAPAPHVVPPPPASPDDAPLPLWSEVKKGVLPNGLTYYIFPHHKPEKRALFWLAVDAGSVQEDEDQRGLAHFDEHMAFNGTKRFPKQDIVNYLEKIGMRFGADLNAYTTWEQTVYQLEVPTDQPTFLAKGLDILRDWAADVTYDPEEVKKEAGVVLEEWRLGRGANKRLFDKHARVLFKGSRYADRITIGQPEIIQKADRAALVRFYKDWYRPDLMAVIAVGDFDAAEIEKAITARFSDVAKPAHERARPSGGVPVADGTRVSIETDREATGTTIAILNETAHRPQASKNDYRRNLAEQLYSEILDERLASIARKPEATFTQAFGSISSLVRDVDAFQRFAVVKGDKTADALRSLLTEVARIERHGITATELERARTNLARAISEAAETEATSQSREFTDEITRNFFQHELMIGRAAESKLALEALPQITVDEIEKDVKAFAGGANRVIEISAPDGKPLPTKEQVMAIVGEVEHAKLDAWDDKPPAAALMAKPPAPGKITKETKNDKVGLVEWKLSNGVHVIVKPTDYEVDAVTIVGTSPGGEAMANPKDFNSARFADNIVDASGVGDFDIDALTKVLAGKQVRVNTAIADTTEEVEASGSVHDLETLLQLVHLRMTAPRKDEQAFSVWKAASVQQITNAEASPEYKFYRDSTAVLWKDNIHRTVPTAADVEKIDLDKALAFYKDRYGDASDFTFVIVGAVDVEKLRPLVETYLASLPAKGRIEKEKDLGIRKVGGVVKKEWHFGTEPKASVKIDFHGDEPWSREKDRDMQILSSVLSIKLREVLREDMSGVYGVRASGQLTRRPHAERSFVLQFGCDPKRVDELVKAAFDQIAALAKDGPTQDYLDKFKETFTRSRETELRTNRFWASWLGRASRYGDDPAIVLDPAPVLARATAANVKAAAKHFIDLKQYAQLVLLPEK